MGHRPVGGPACSASRAWARARARVDARTDVYGLGAVLYYVLTGQPPHEGQTISEVIEQARGAPIIAPHRKNPRVPRGLERICLKSMAPDPRSRLPSADALRRALLRDRVIRPVAPVLGVLALLLCLLVPVWAFWPGSLRPSAVGPSGVIAGRGPTLPQSEPKPASPGAASKPSRSSRPPGRNRAALRRPCGERVAEGRLDPRTSRIGSARFTTDKSLSS